MMERLSTLNFGQPAWLILLLLVPLVAWLQGKKGRAVAVQYSALSILRRIGGESRNSAGRWLRRMGLFALFLLVLAMARPRIERGGGDDRRDGVDIVLCVDISGSMDEKDFDYDGKKISRLDALMMAIDEFVDKRPNDRFGMIGFCQDTFRLSPLTLDGEWIKGILRQVQTRGGTAIGDGLLGSITLLKESTSKSKVVVLVTDGENKSGVSPTKAADEARRQNIRVHTMEIVSLQKVAAGNAVKGLLSEVASKTGGLYFQAANLDALRGVYSAIDSMEKSRLDQRRTRLYDELFYWFVIPAFFLLFSRWVGGYTIWMKVP